MFANMTRIIRGRNPIIVNALRKLVPLAKVDDTEQYDEWLYSGFEYEYYETQSSGLDFVDFKAFSFMVGKVFYIMDKDAVPADIGELLGFNKSKL